jgi:polyisoprenoid-binding protein YceI
MKHLKYLLLSACTFVLITSATIINKYTLDKDYTVTIHGTSNLHDWDENVGTVTGDAIIDWNADKSFDLNGVHIKMDVHSIKSHEGSGMNNNTYKALKADANPTISFTLNQPLKSIKTNSTKNDVSMEGSLTIAGVTKPIVMKATLVMDSQSRLTIEGSYTIKMADYNVTPPTALFGTIRTGDTITLNFKGSFIISN